MNRLLSMMNGESERTVSWFTYLFGNNAEVLNVTKAILLVLLCMLAIAMIFIVLKQSGDPEDLGAITGNSESYYAKNKGKSKEELFKKATVWVGIGIVVVSILYFIIQIEIAV